VGSADELRALALPEDRASMLAADPRAVKARAESLDWVANVEVRRLWPSRLEIRVERRDAIARWQEDGDVSLIDVNGERVLTRRAAARDDLPLVVGENAGPAARDMLAALDAAPAVRERTTALVRVGGRRWDLRLRSGADVSLPESGVGDALETLEVLQADHRLLDRPVARIDLRDPARLVVTPRAPATAAAETARQGA
jgi:cell division protein FtsQ